jgi:uncharacterized protein
MMNKELIKLILLGIVLTAGAFWLAVRFVQPAPPRHFTLAAGPEGGAYLEWAYRYQAELAKQDVTVEVITTSGSVDNLELLTATNGADVAFVQTGIPVDATADVVGLAALYYEPLWIFTRTEAPIRQIHDLTGLRMAAGADGGGTRPVVDALLQEHRMGPDTIELLPLNGGDALAEIDAGNLDGVFFVTAVSSPLVRQYLERPDLRIAKLDLTTSLARRLPFLNPVAVSRGLFDPARDFPQEPMELLAPVASLAARADFHPALMDLLLTVVQQEHRDGDLLAQPGDFPRMEPLAAPISPDAERFFTAGLPFLKRVLPFWAATLVARMWVMIIPLLTILIPLMKILPPTYHWRLRSQIFRLYRRLKAVDAARVKANEEERQEEHSTWLADLQQIEKETEQLNVPLSYADRVYHLKLHIQFVKNQLGA